MSLNLRDPATNPLQLDTTPPHKSGKSDSPALQAAKRSANADRGKYAEGKAAQALKDWSTKPGREANRLLDTRAAHRIVRAAAADFEFFCKEPAAHGLIEVKETKHAFRLAHDKVPQLARLRWRTMAGGLCAVLVFHSENKLWRSPGINWLTEHMDGASWNLSALDVYPSAAAALEGIFPRVFGR